MKKSAPLILVVIGALEFMNVSRNPRFAAVHTVDVVGLLGCGACFGVALMLASLIWRKRL